MIPTDDLVRISHDEMYEGTDVAYISCVSSVRFGQKSNECASVYTEETERVNRNVCIQAIEHIKRNV
jgi:hypothetical protein